MLLSLNLIDQEEPKPEFLVEIENEGTIEELKQKAIEVAQKIQEWEGACLERSRGVDNDLGMIIIEKVVPIPIGIEDPRFSFRKSGDK